MAASEPRPGDSYVEILLVEDEWSDADLCMRALSRNRVANQVSWVKDGAEALDFLFARGRFAGRDVADTPRVILLDLKLPKVDGFEVLRELRADARLKTIPVVVLTSSAEERDVLETYELGVNSYVTKPLDFESFQRVVEDLGMYWVIHNRGPQQATSPTAL